MRIARVWRWLRRPFSRPTIPEVDRLRLEGWVRTKLLLGPSDPWEFLIATTARLTEAGMTTDEAVSTVARITSEGGGDGAAG